MIKNLVFEGGGAKGIAYLGAIDALAQRNLLPQITRVAGASAGAINAALLAVTQDLDTIHDFINGLDMSLLTDDDPGILRDTHRFIFSYGWHKGEAFEQWLGQLIPPDLKFLHLPGKGYLDLHIVGSNLSKGKSEVFSYWTTPEMPILKAVRISMSIPFFFQAVTYQGDVYVDGGLLRNYPIRMFDKKKFLAPDPRAEDAESYVVNPQTMGFRLDSTAELIQSKAAQSSQGIHGIVDYIKALCGAMLNVQDNVYLNEDDWSRTVFIDTLGYSALDFDMSDADRQVLYVQGKEAVLKYLDKLEAM